MQALLQNTCNKITVVEINWEVVLRFAFIHLLVEG